MVLIFAWAGGAATAWAQQNQQQSADIRQFEQKLLELQRQMEQMKKEHEVQLQGLKE